MRDWNFKIIRGFGEYISEYKSNTFYKTSVFLEYW